MTTPTDPQRLMTLALSGDREAARLVVRAMQREGTLPPTGKPVSTQYACEGDPEPPFLIPESNLFAGRRLIAVDQPDDDDERLVFRFEDGGAVQAKTYIACMNNVWFLDLEQADIDAVLGGIVWGVIAKGWQHADDDDYQGDDEAEEVGWWSVVTSKGHLDLEVRNNHNGYYGGSVDWSEVQPEPPRAELQGAEPARVVWIPGGTVQRIPAPEGQTAYTITITNAGPSGVLWVMGDEPQVISMDEDSI